MGDENSLSVVEYPIESVDLIRCVVGFQIALDTPDRVGETIQSKAFDYSNHAKNPVALFAHDKQLPIGACENRVTKEYAVKEIGSKTIGEIWFNQADWQVGMRIFDLCAQRVIRGISPGFIKKKMDGKIYTLAELVEVSVCVLPEHPDSLVQWVQKTLNIKDQVDERIFKHLKLHIPENTSVTATVTATPPPAAPVAPVVEIITKDLKPGAKVLQSLHTAALAMKVMLKDLESQHDNPNVTECIKGLDDSIDEHVEKMTDIYGKDYPDADELKAEEKAMHSIPISEIKHLKEVEKSLKIMQDRYAELGAKFNRLNKKGTA